MDAKELQKVYKQARAAIDSKDFKEAIRICKAVLKESENNYNVLVFFGVASEGLEDSDSALAAYVKATNVSPDQILAWQGLSRFYERRAVTASDQKRLLEVYRKLFNLSDDSKKKFDFATKMYNLAEQLGDVAELIEAHKLCIGLTSDAAELWARFVAFISKPMPTGESDAMDALTSAFEYCSSVDSVFSANATRLVPLWTKVIAHLQKVGQLDKMEIACQRMAQSRPRDSLPYLTLGRALVDFSCAEILCPLTIDPIALQTVLEDLTPDNVILSALRAAPLLRQETGAATVQAYELLESGAANKHCPPSVRVLFAWTCCRLHRYDDAEKCLARAGFMKTAPSASRVLDDVLSCCAAAIGRRAALLQMECAAMTCVAASPASANNSGVAVDSVKDILLPSFVETYGEHWRAFWLAGQGCLQLGNMQGVLEVCTMLSVLSEPHELALQGAVALRQGQPEVAEASLLKAIDKLGDEPLFHLWLGCAYAQQESKRHLSVACFLTSAKLDRFKSETFLRLGHYYATSATPDKDRALNCYLKAHELYTSSVDAGTAAADTAFACGKADIAVQVLERVTSRSPIGRAKGAWLRLGLYKLKIRDYNAAVHSLQCALRADTQDSHCWESLADAYFNRGSYVAALKSFTKAHELNPSAKYPLLKIAEIKAMQREYAEATGLYEQLLADQPDYMPALKGLGETHVAQAKAKLADFLDDTAAAHCRDAIGYYCRALQIRPSMACLWKALGDACTLLHPVSDLTLNGSRLSLPAWLLVWPHDKQQRRPKASPEQPAPTDQLTDVESVQLLLAAGCRCYAQVIHLAPNNSAGWHDLGVALLLLSQRKKIAADGGEATREELAPSALGEQQQLGCGPAGLLGASRLQLLRRAEHCLKRAVQLAPAGATVSLSQSWSALGLVEAADEIKDYAIAQHCFIKAVQLQNSNVAAWVNLGILYLQNGNLQLANQAFGRAQAADPSYPQAWIGQAQIAAVMDNSEESMDLLRHACLLGHHLESQAGYADAVVNVLSDAASRKELTEHYQYSILKMSAVAAATDALDRYTRRATDDAVMHNTFGLLLERQGLLHRAQESYARAAALSSEIGRKVSGTSSAQSLRSDALDYLVNSSRVLSRLGRHEEAMQQCSELFAHRQTFDDACHLAQLHYAAGHFDDSYRVYDVALTLADNDADKAEVLAAMGLVAFRRGEIDTAKTALFTGCQIPTASSVHCVGMLAAVGAATGDAVLLDAALIELRKVPPTRSLGWSSPLSLAADVHGGEGSPIVGDMLSKLECRRNAMANDVKASRNALLKAIHRKPSSIAARSRLLRWWLRTTLVPQPLDSRQLSPVAAVSPIMNCESALRFSRAVAVLDGTLSSTASGIVTPLVLTLLSLGLPREAASTAKKAVHANPSSAHKWLQLVAACHAQLQASPIDSQPLHCTSESQGSSDVRLSLVALHHAESLSSEQYLLLAAVVSVILSFNFGAKWLDPPSADAQECASRAQQAYAAAAQDAVRGVTAAAGPLSVLDALDAFVRKDLDGLGRLLTAAKPAAPFAWLLYACLLSRSGAVPAAEAVCRTARDVPTPPEIADSSSRIIFDLHRAALALTFSDQLPPSVADEALANARAASLSVAALGTPAQHVLQALAGSRAAAAATAGETANGSTGSAGLSGDTRRVRSLAEKALMASNSPASRRVLRRYVASLCRGTKVEREKLEELVSQAEADRDEEFVTTFSNTKE